MKKAVICFLLGSCFLAFNITWAAERGTAAQAKQMVEKAEAFFKANGKEKALAEFNNPQGQFVKEDLYVGAWDLNGNILAQPMNPKVVGTNGLNVPDAEG